MVYCLGWAVLVSVGKRTQLWAGVQRAKLATTPFLSIRPEKDVGWFDLMPLPSSALGVLCSYLSARLDLHFAPWSRVVCWFDPSVRRTDPTVFYACSCSPVYFPPQILAMVDGLMVHQEVETLEAIANAAGIGYEGNNQ